MKAFWQTQNKFTAVLVVVNRVRNRKAILKLCLYPALHSVLDILKGSRISIPVAHTTVKFPNHSEVIGTALIGNVLYNNMIRTLKLFTYIHLFLLLVFAYTLKYGGDIGFLELAFCHNGNYIAICVYILAV